MQIGSQLSEALGRYLDLTSDQMKLTAGNLANQQTAGYTRQVVSFNLTDTVSLNSNHGNGAWVTATTSSQRDRVLEQRLQQATSSSTSSDSRLGALQSVEAAFGLSSAGSNASSTALGSAMDGFFSSLSALSANPTDASTRGAVLTAASTLASAFNDAAGAINNQSADLNSQIATASAQIDELTSTIAQLNGQISAQSPGSDAGTLEDQRQVAVKQLSALLGVNSISTENNGLTLTTSAGAVLVSGSQSYPVTTTNVGGKIELVAGDPASTQVSVDGGSIGGMMQARDQDLPSMLATLDQLANSLGSAVNTQNAAGITPSGAAGGAIFSLPATVSGSAASIAVALRSTDGIATAAAGQGAAGTGNASALANLGTATIVSGETASNFYGDFIGELGNTVQSATAADTAGSAALTQAQTQRDSFSAVNLDDEASALTQYQRSYEAAAKVFDIVNQVMASALNLGQETTVS